MARIECTPTNANRSHVDAMLWLGGILDRKCELRELVRNDTTQFDVTVPGYTPTDKPYRVIAGCRQEAIDTACDHHGVSVLMRGHVGATAVEVRHG